MSSKSIADDTSAAERVLRNAKTQVLPRAKPRDVTCALFPHKLPICARRTVAAPLTVAVSMLLVICLVANALQSYGQVDQSRITWTSPDLSWSLEKPLNWAQYSPFTPVAPYIAPPTGCAVSQVNLIERHGARYPTSGATTRITAAVEKLLAATEYTNQKLHFLKTYEYDLGQDDLVSFGAQQARESGLIHRARYHHLFLHGEEPFVRSSGGTRVIDTATNWTIGFSALTPPPVSVILEENGSASNNTLDDNMCDNAGNSDEQDAAWLSVFAPTITVRLNAWAPGANLSDVDTYSLISLCPFDSVAKEKHSAWCDVFDEASDFEGFEYYGDIDKYYGTGYGGYLGKVQGVGYINELLARLTNSPVNDTTQTNSTLDGNSDTFPLDRTMYADFSHDNQMIAIYTAMGLFEQPELLSLSVPDRTRTWRADRLVSFSARMVVEKVECGDREYVRVMVNDALQALSFCGNRTMCSLDDFVESQSYSRSAGEGDWPKCFE